MILIIFFDQYHLQQNHLIIHKLAYFDHKNLEELFNRARNFRARKLYRWATRLQEFDFDAYINESRNARKRATHDIEALYLSHFHSQIIDGHSDHIGYNSNNINKCNYYFDGIEHELYNDHHLLPSYARKFNTKYYKNDGIDAVPYDYLNN
eukprot:932503_1